jgi:RNA polymerase sigma factor (sigma-70 family)
MTRPSDPIRSVPPSRRAGGQGSRAAVEAVWRIEAARLIASLARLTGDLADAEDLPQDALVAALEQWPAHGIPPNPGGWLMSTAKNRLIDQIRRHKTMQRKLPHLHHEQERQDQAADAGRDARLDDQIGDELLGLIFTACHPALSIESRVALTLRCVGGLSTDQIARALLIGEPTAAQRIVRAKKTLRDKHVAFELPSPEEIRQRLPGVLHVLYLIFNEGYAASSGPEWIRPSLCEELLRQARVLAGVLPELAEVHGFLALLELQTARLPARTTGDGDPVLILDQDRRLWDRLLIARGLEAMHRAERLAATGSPVGPYMLQAGIAACHARARRPQDTDWKTILGLYDVLRTAWPNPVVELNRTVAVAMVNGPRAALAKLDKLSGDPRLRGYCYLPAVRAHVLEQAGQHAAARDSWLLAAKLTRTNQCRSDSSPARPASAPTGSHGHSAPNWACRRSSTSASSESRKPNTT